MVRFIPWFSQTKGTFPPPVYISHNLKLNHLSAYRVISSRMSLGLRVYSSPLFFDPVSLLMAYQHNLVLACMFCSSLSSYIIHNLNHNTRNIILHRLLHQQIKTPLAFGIKVHIFYRYYVVLYISFTGI